MTTSNGKNNGAKRDEAADELNGKINKKRETCVKRLLDIQEKIDKALGR